MATLERKEIKARFQGGAIRVADGARSQLGFKENEALLLIPEGDSLRVISESARAASSADSRAPAGTEVLLEVLQREYGFTPARTPAPGGVLRGELSALPLSDAVSFLSLTHKTGVLLLENGREAKGILIGRGEVVGAVSNVEKDRLGSFLVSRGKIEPGLWEEFRDSPSGDTKLKQTLLSKHVFTDEELRAQQAALAEDIVLGVFHWPEGVFTFHQGEFTLDPSQMLRLRTANLMMEGVKRLDELAEIRRAIKPETVLALERLRPLIQDGAKLALDQWRTLCMLDGRCTVGKICREGPLSEFDTLSLFSQLLRAGHLSEVTAPVRSARFQWSRRRVRRLKERQRFLQIITEFNNVFSLIWQSIRLALGDEGEALLVSYMKGLPRGSNELADRLDLESDGTLNPERVLANLSRQPHKEQERVLRDGLAELVMFQLLTARAALEEEAATELTTLVTGLLREMGIDL